MLAMRMTYKEPSKPVIIVISRVSEYRKTWTCLEEIEHRRVEVAEHDSPAISICRTCSRIRSCIWGHFSSYLLSEKAQSNNFRNMGRKAVSFNLTTTSMNALVNALSTCGGVRQRGMLGKL